MDTIDYYNMFDADLRRMKDSVKDDANLFVELIEIKHNRMLNKDGLLGNPVFIHRSSTKRVWN